MEKYFGLAKELLDKGFATESMSYQEDNTYDSAIDFTDDLELYRQLSLQQGGKVLDIGCGTGRVMLPLLEAGIEVIGMDMSPHMLDIASGKLKEAGFSPQLCQGDMRNFSLQQQFSLIIIPYFSLIYMKSNEERLRVLQCCYQHLEMGGLLVFDFDSSIGEPGLSKPWLSFQTVDPHNNIVIVQTAQMNQVKPHLRIVNIITYRLMNEESLIDVNASIESSISSDEMRELLQQVGFSIRGFFSDYNFTPYEDGEECVVIAEK